MEVEMHDKTLYGPKNQNEDDDGVDDLNKCKVKLGLQKTSNGN